MAHVFRLISKPSKEKQKRNKPYLKVCRTHEVELHQTSPSNFVFFLLKRSILAIGDVFCDLGISTNASLGMQHSRLQGFLLRNLFILLKDDFLQNLYVIFLYNLFQS